MSILDLAKNLLITLACGAVASFIVKKFPIDDGDASQYKSIGQWIILAAVLIICIGFILSALGWGGWSPR